MFIKLNKFFAYKFVAVSAKLFNIFYDSLIEKLDNLKFFIIAYADDITIAVIEHE